jgi:hypothetical protein
MKKLSYPVLALFVFAAVSCKKSGSSNCRLSFENHYDNGGVLVTATSYHYDDLGRVTRMTNGQFVTNLVYYTDSIVRMEGGETTTYYLNSNKMAFLSRTSFSPNPLLLAFEDSYTYDAEGHLTQVREIFSQLYNGSILRDTSFINFTMQNGNIIKESGTAMEDLNYEYANLQAPEHIAIIQKGLFTWSFLGKPSRNLVSRITNNSGQVLTEYQYQFDSFGNIQKTSFTGSNGSGSIQYGYNCD